MSIARIQTALSQHKKTILKYSVMGGIIGGGISATIGSLVALRIEYGKLCRIEEEMAPNYNCKIVVTHGPHNAYSCDPRCSTPANASLLLSDAEKKNPTILPAVAEFSAAFGVGVGILMGATYGIYTAIKNSRTALTEPLLAETQYTENASQSMFGNRNQGVSTDQTPTSEIQDENRLNIA